MEDVRNQLGFRPGELERVKQQIHALGRRDWIWWSAGILSLLVVLGGGLGLWLLHASPWQSTLTVPLVGLVGFLYAAAVCVAVLSLVVLLRQKENQRVKTELLLEILENEVGRLQGMFDPMTRVYNRYCLEELLQKEISRSQRYSKTFALILIDLDRFKEINDRFGHLMGDFVLAEVAQVLHSCVRGSDLIVRYGGDEFVLVLSETDLLGAQVVVNRIHEKVAEWSRNNKVARFELGVSTGVSIFSEGKKIADLIAEADQQMYSMKHAAGGSATASLQ